jgi:anthranilate phosphoribosyltransferase
MSDDPFGLATLNQEESHRKPVPEAAPAEVTPESLFGGYLQRIADRHDLNRSDAASALELILDGTASDTEAAAFLMGLRVKGETSDEIAGLLEVMHRMVVPVETADREALVDIVGTGGDQLGTFNISTAAAFVAAGAGVKVAKHGSRAASSRCGSADVLEALGVRTDLLPAEIATCIEKVGMGFMLATRHHPVMGKVAPIRRALGLRTVFNFLGPLTNPAGVQRMVLGVSSAEHLGVLAGALARLGCRHALLVRSDEGMDELSVASSTTVVEVTRGVVQPPYSLSPEECGVQRWALRGLTGGDVEANALIVRGVLSGKEGAPRDAAVINAAAALYVGGAVSSLREGADVAAAAINDGRAAKVLENLAALTTELAQGR